MTIPPPTGAAPPSSTLSTATTSLPPPAPTPSSTVITATSPTEIDAVRELFSAYADSLGLDLGYQSFSSELASLPGKYAHPTGVIFLATLTTLTNPSPLSSTTTSFPLPAEYIGCVAVRPFSPGVCELKRLYVSPAGRRTGTGSRLLDAALKFATEAGYERIVLDTLRDEHHAAIALYKSRGFEEIEQYYETPILERTLFLGKRLTTS